MTHETALFTLGFLLGIGVCQVINNVYDTCQFGRDRRKSERRHPGVPEKVDPNDSN